jgi:tyrosine-protein kinase Etk/Wzc
MDRTIALATLWDRVWARRRPILILVISATLLVGIISFLLPPWYEAEAELLPPSEEETGLGVASLLRGAGVPGIRLPTQVAPGDVFLVILESRRINEQVVERFNLKKLYNQKYTSDAVDELRDHVRFKLTMAGTIQIAVEDRDRQRAADMANAYVEFLDQFNRQVRMTKGRRTRLFIEARLVETKRELAAAEQRLTEYQTRNKTVALSPGVSSAVEEAARMYARRMALQVRLGVIRSYSEGSEEELQIIQELAQLDRQLRALPETGLELARLFRDVKAMEQVFALLTAQYEEARITEARDVVTVELLDEPKPPERKSRPRRGTMIASAFLLSLALGMGLAIVQREKQTRPMMRAVAAE